jgi:ABC-type phosphate transport system substrate-binding protein
MEIVMKNSRVRLLFSLLAVVGMTMFSLVSIPPAQAAGDTIVVIVNVSNPVQNLSMSELKKLFMSDRSKWDTGKAVAPVMVAAGAPERTAFLKIVCGLNDADFAKYFVQAAFTGKDATPPKEVGSAQAVKGVVTNSPGAIGFVKAGDFNSDSTIKAVKIDGLAASDAGYKLKM